jgi:flagellar L-ring protein FlgH
MLSMHVAAADSLFNPEGYHALAADHRALKVGDNLTIVVTEIASATTDARTSSDKTGSVSGAANLHQLPQQGAFNLNETFSGGGTIERSGKLLARMTVVVQAIDANGDLQVKGQQDIVLNGDRQKLALDGRVRPEDIGADNTVLSSRLSNAHISYVGTGVLAEKQRAGLFTRLLSWLHIL